MIHQYFGISLDEKSRAFNIGLRCADKPRVTAHFPLIDQRMTRTDCMRILERYGCPIKAVRSACVFCPYHSDGEWLDIKNNDPRAWQRAVEIDTALRTPGTVANRNV